MAGYQLGDHIVGLREREREWAAISYSSYCRYSIALLAPGIPQRRVLSP